MARANHFERERKGYTSPLDRLSTLQSAALSNAHGYTYRETSHTDNVSDQPAAARILDEYSEFYFIFMNYYEIYFYDESNSLPF